MESIYSIKIKERMGLVIYEAIQKNYKKERIIKLIKATNTRTLLNEVKVWKQENPLWAPMLDSYIESKDIQIKIKQHLKNLDKIWYDWFENDIQGWLTRRSIALEMVKIQFSHCNYKDYVTFSCIQMHLFQVYGTYIEEAE